MLSLILVLQSLNLLALVLDVFWLFVAVQVFGWQKSSPL
tara:strand:+ start:605 stop:721 length:117 start_codon:yes stop_codon:yes gene_type:complete